MTDSSADIPADILAQGHIGIVPMMVELNDENLEHKGSSSWDSKAFYDRLRSGSTGRTSQITPGVYTEHFEKVLAAGQDILYLSLSGGLSSTFDSARLAASNLKEDYPARSVACVDSRAATGGQGILALCALRNQEKGMTLEENAAWLEENRLRVCHWFTVDDLDFLKRGGRISPTLAWIGGRLKIKPVLRIAENGKLEIPEKVRGPKAAMSAISGKYLQSAHDPEYPYVLLCHGDAQEEALKLKDTILEGNPGAEVHVMPMSPVIGVHTGPGVQAVIYMGSNR